MTTVLSILIYETITLWFLCKNIQLLYGFRFGRPDPNTREGFERNKKRAKHKPKANNIARFS